MKTNFMVVNGILTDSDSVDGWTDFFEDFYQNMGYPCTKYEYTCGFMNAWFQGKRVQDIIKILKRITNPLVYVGHSNGCEIFHDVVRKSDINFESAHLFGAAMDNDFNTNGLNYALLSGKIKKVYLYCSRNDIVLKKWANRSRYFQIFGMHYGDMGYSGPKNILKQVEDRVYVKWENSFNHSDWFSEKNIDDSFRATLRK